MTKTVTHIEVPKEWESTSDWDSHRPALYLAVKKLDGIDGFRVECGCGHGSTKLLTDYYKDKGGLSHESPIVRGELFISYEANKEWSEKFEWVQYVENYFSCFWLSTLLVKLLFVDCAPGEIRGDIIRKYKDVATVIVVHDTEPTASYVYGLVNILATFKYRLDYEPEGNPHTTIVSNFIDVTKWVE